MRRQGGHYGGDSGGGGHAYGGDAAQMQQNTSSKSGNYAGRHQEQYPVGEKEERRQNQWRWERDATQSKLPQAAMSPTAPFGDGQGREAAPISYYQNQRMDPRIPLDKQGGGGGGGGGGDPRSRSHEADVEIKCEDDRVLMTYEGLEQRFIEDIIKLSKEQTDAEDAENARHRERTNAINKQYEEQLAALRARHASRREEFLQRESQARKQQYHHQQLSMENYPNSNVDPPNDPRSDPRGFTAGTAPEPNRAYSSEHYAADSYRERGRFPGNNARDHGYEPKVPYPRGRAYDTSSRFY